MWAKTKILNAEDLLQQDKNTGLLSLTCLTLHPHRKIAPSNGCTVVVKLSENADHISPLTIDLKGPACSRVSFVCAYAAERRCLATVATGDGVIVSSSQVTSPRRPRWNKPQTQDQTVLISFCVMGNIRKHPPICSCIFNTSRTFFFFFFFNPRPLKKGTRKRCTTSKLGKEKVQRTYFILIGQREMILQLQILNVH